MKTLNDGFYLVYDVEHLQRVLEFLEDGFSWDSNKSTKIFNRLKMQSPSIPTAAFFFENNKIKIAILIFHQTYFPIVDKNVVNLSAWYAENSHRGIEAIRFAKQLTSNLDSYIITNYTPSAAAIKVFKALGYEDMHVKADSIGAQKKFPFIRFRLQDKYFSLIRNHRSNVKLTDNQQSETANFIYKISTIKKMGIKLSTLNIYLAGEKNRIPLLWFLKFVFCHGILRVNLYSKGHMAPENPIWLIKNCDEEPFIFPRNSELSV